MKILYICPTDPRETSYGGQQRTHVIWKGLRTAGEAWTAMRQNIACYEMEHTVSKRAMKWCCAIISDMATYKSFGVWRSPKPFLFNARLKKDESSHV